MSNPTRQNPLLASYDGRTFRIIFGGESIGYYLYVYEGNRCTHDYLQDSLAAAQEEALQLFGVPRDGWTEVD